MPRDRSSPDKSFNELLTWLHPEPETAAVRYETIRADLIRIFRWRSCSDPEGMADETIIRVTRKLGEMAASYTGSPTSYFYGVAKNLLHEYDRKRDINISPQAEQFIPAPQTSEENDDSSEWVYECFEACLRRLEPRQRKLVLSYYDGQGKAKIDGRKRLANKLGVDLNALRVRTRRIRSKLRECIEECLAKYGSAT